MKLSVVVPFYNVELYIRDCLASIARQTLSDFEVLLVDDGSPDGSRAIAEEYAEADDRFRIITQQNQGLGPARNTGMRQATGEYLTFVDSDDIIPKRAFETMVERLDSSGSDFAAGDAQRFNLHGIRESWLHQEPFAVDLHRAQVQTHPMLANDRMVWNKVYRRSFWERGGYEFPAIMYEDYPVTLRAHLDATAVEVISDPIYMWRERDAGSSSITQRVYEARNIKDRVTSALMVFDLLADVPHAIATTVHRHLMTTDFGAIARAVALAEGTEALPEVLADAQRFAVAVDPDVVLTRPPLDRVLHQLLLQGRVEDVARLIAVRDEVLPPAGHEVDDAQQDRRLITLPGTDLGTINADTRALRDDELHVAGRLRTSTWDTDRPGRLRLEVETWIHFSGQLDDPSVRAWLRSRRGHGDLDVDVVATRPIARHKLLVTVEVDAPQLLVQPGQEEETHPWTLWLEIATEGLTRSGPVRGRASSTPVTTSPWQADDWTWVQPGHHRGRFVVNVVRRQTVISRVSTHNAGEITVHGRSREPLDRGVLLRAAIDDDLDGATLYPVRVEGLDERSWSAHLQLAPFVDPERRDPLVDQVLEHQLTLVDRESETTPTLDPALANTRRLIKGQEVQLVSNRFHAARIDITNPEFAIEEVSLAEDGAARLRGRWINGSSAADQVLLQWYHDLNEPEEFAVNTAADDGWLEFEVDLTALAIRTETVLHGSTEANAPVPAAQWDASLWHQGEQVTVHVMPSVERQLPAAWRGPNGAAVQMITHRRRALRFVVLPPPA